MKYKTKWTKPDEVERKWYVVDVSGKVLGRAATQIAKLLMGKGKVTRVDNVDSGDYVVVINSSKIEVTRGKEERKMYYRHSGYPGGFKEIRFDKQMIKDPTFAISAAVENMLPKNKLQNEMMKRLFVYADSNHKHEAQKPVEYKLS